MKKGAIIGIIILAVVIYLVIAGFSNLMLSPKKITNQGSDALLPLERLTPKQVLTHRTLDGRGDLNCDSLVDFADINPFVFALSNPTAYGNTFPDCDMMNGDINCNGQFGFDDINLFVACLTEGACPHYEACAFCGDGVADPGEDCDYPDLNGQTCQTLGYDSGDLSCNPDCTFNTGQCQEEPGDCLTSNSQWQNIPFDQINGRFKIEFDAKPLENNINALTAFSFNPIDSEDDYVFAVRFNDQGKIDIHSNNPNYHTGFYADRNITYTAGKNYHFRIETSAMETFGWIYVYVTPEGQAEQRLAEYLLYKHYVSHLNYLGVSALTGSHKVCNLAIIPQTGFDAQFEVEKLIAVDPITKEETWVPTGTFPDDPIENGLKIRLNALDYSTGGIIYRWKRGGYTVDSRPIAYEQYTSPGNFDYTLQIYNSTYATKSITKTVYVADKSINKLSTTPYSGEDFYPGLYAHLGTDLWAIGSGKIGVVDLSDPSNLPPVQIMPDVTVGIGVQDLAVGNEILAYARGTNGGVYLYHADPNNFVFLKEITLGELGAESAYSLEIEDNILYVNILNSAETPQSKIKVYDISDPYNPVFLETLDVFPEGVVNFFKVGDEALLAQKFYNEFRLIDIRNPSQPQVLPQTIELESGTYQRVVVYEHTVAASLSFSLQTALFDVIVPESASEPLSISQINMLPLNSHTCAYTKQRLYACVDGYAYLGKFDIINPQETYRMETFYPCYLYTQYHMYDPDGSLGPAQPVILLEAGPYGFISYSS